MATKPADRSQPWPAVPPFQAYLGIEILERKDGRSRLLLPFKPEICNRKGDIHGGASAALVDLAMSLAIRSQTDGVAGLSTISMTINYLDPGQGALTATGKVTKFGRTIAIAEAQVHAEDGSLVVQASGAFRLIWPKPAG